MSDERDWHKRRSQHGNRASDSGQPPASDQPTERLTGGPSAGLPFDMSDVHIDDQFLDALGSGGPVPTRDDAEFALAGLLAGWRDEVLSAPAPALPTVEEVETAIAAAQKAERPRRITRHLRLASGVAAVVVVAIAGLTVLSEGSKPGDPLWAVKSVVFASAASQTQASVDVQSNLERAEAAIAAGDTTAAQSLVSQAEKDMAPLDNGETRDRMNQWITRLKATATSSETASTSSSATPTQDGVTTTDQPSSTQNDPSRDRLMRSRGDSHSTKPSRPSPSGSQQPEPSQGDNGSGQPQEPVTTTPTPTSAQLPYPSQNYPQNWPTTTTTTPMWSLWPN